CARHARLAAFDYW
nr:immunoglobulin heavy chain junction region [Mus musculus]MBK4197900.1 immunoglobulin heavy chain junction region [Mus musculus]